MSLVEELTTLLFAELSDDNRLDSELEIIGRLMQAEYDAGVEHGQEFRRGF